MLIKVVCRAPGAHTARVSSRLSQRGHGKICATVSWKWLSELDMFLTRDDTLFHLAANSRVTHILQLLILKILAITLGLNGMFSDAIADYLETAVLSSQ
jgi:hypothetical protein